MDNAMRLQKVSLIGTGNAATQFAQGFFNAGIEVVDILGRREEATAVLAAQVKAQVCLDWSALQQHEGLYLIAVSDDAIEEVGQKLRQTLGAAITVAHCSGATSSAKLAADFETSGVFYPLQSLSAARAVDWSQVPLCVYSADAALEEGLWALALQLGAKAYRINDAQRSDLHVAAVFVNNFSNHLFQLAAEICAQKEVNFEILCPLLEHTVEKLRSQSPAQAQTGPAWRGDRGTQARHLKALEELPEHFSAVYRLLSKGIVDFKKKVESLQ